MIFRALIFLLALSLPAKGEEVVAGLSQNRVAITANFDGSEILIFGAVKRDAPAPNDSPLEVIIAVEGPQEPVVVRRKAKRYGIWVNVDDIEVDSAPSFYSIATTGPIREVLNETEDLRRHVSIPLAIRAVGVAEEVGNPQEFVDALIRIRKKAGLYQLLPQTVSLSQETLFETSIALPSNLREGDYGVRIFLTREGQVVDEYTTQLDVRKVGLERLLYNLSREQPLLYGILSIVIAIAAGWTASAVFSYIRN